MALAIFDLDNTLLRGDSDHAWGEFLVENDLVDADSYKEANDYFYQQYQTGQLDILEYLRFALSPLASHPKEQLDKWHDQFMAEKISPMLLEKAEQLLDKHRNQGDTLLIITATNLFITGPIARFLGVENILATEPAFDGLRYTGEVKGIPCFKEGKVSRLKDWLHTHKHSLEGSYFYSDSHNDLPLLEQVSNPVAVDPDDSLRSIAEQRGWPVISLR